MPCGLDWEMVCPPFLFAHLQVWEPLLISTVCYRALTLLGGAPLAPHLIYKIQ